MEKNNIHKFVNALHDKKEEVEKKPPIQIAFNKTPIDVFRYSLTGLLVSVKLGLFAYMANPLVEVSWFLVFLPAVFLELGIAAFLLLLAAGTVVVLLIYALWLSFRFLVIDRIIRRRLRKKVADAEKAGTPSGDAAVDLMAALQRAAAKRGPRPRND